MSFDIFLQRFRSGEPAAADKQPVLALLETIRHKPAEHGIYELLFADGSSVDFAAKELTTDEPFQGCAFFTHGVSDAALEAIYRVAKAARMVILPADAPNSAIFVDSELKAGVPPEVLTDFIAIEVSSPAELRVALRLT